MACSCSSCWVNSGVTYTIVVIWLVVNSWLMWRTYNEYKYSPDFFYLHEILGAGLCWSRGTAAVINLNLGALLIPMCRTILAVLRGTGCLVSIRTTRILIDHCKGFHLFTAYIVVVASVVHFFGHCFNAMNYSEHFNNRLIAINAASKPNENPFLIVLRSVPGVTGLLLLVVLMMMISSATYAVRSMCYDVFWYVHRLFFVFYVLVFVHGMRGILMRQCNVGQHTPGCLYINGTEPWPESEPEPELARVNWTCVEEPVFDTIGCSTWLWTMIPLCLYVGDVMYRLIDRERNAAILTNVNLLRDQILELHIRKNNFICRPGQYVMIQYPQISAFEWHPYTVTKVPIANSTESFSIHIKVDGDWSANLKDYLTDEEKSTTNTDMLLENKTSRRILIDGPFGSPMEDVLRYRVCLCIAGGIGITPFIALLNYLRNLHHARLHRFYLIWVCRDIDTFLCFAHLLCDIYSEFWQSSKPDLFNVKLFATSTDSRTQVSLLDDFAPLKRRLFYGRPNWSCVLHRVASTFPDQTVGVFCCGSKSLSTEVGSCCLRSCHNRTKFHFYHESF